MFFGCNTHGIHELNEEKGIKVNSWCERKKRSLKALVQLFFIKGVTGIGGF
jgi:hypothetical protein